MIHCDWVGEQPCRTAACSHSHTPSRRAPPPPQLEDGLHASIIDVTQDDDEHERNADRASKHDVTGVEYGASELLLRRSHPAALCLFLALRARVTHVVCTPRVVPTVSAIATAGCRHVRMVQPCSGAAPLPAFSLHPRPHPRVPALMTRHISSATHMPAFHALSAACNLQVRATGPPA